MPSLPLNSIDLPEVEFRPFFEALKRFMKEEILNVEFLGVKTLTFRAELNKGGGFEVVADTNKAMNQASTQQLRNMIRGFRGGWLANRRPPGDEHAQV